MDTNKRNQRHERPSILIVDDDVTICQWLSLGLEVHGIESAFAGDAFSAMHFCKKFHPDLVVLDLHLGDHAISGTEVLWGIKNDPELASTVVLIFTGCADEEVQRLCMDEIGADGYLIKGATKTSDLIQAVDKWLRRIKVRGAAQEISGGPVRVNLSQSRAYLGEQTLPLTPREFNVLALTIRKKALVPWATLAGRLFKMGKRYQYQAAADPVETCLRHLRAKLGPESERLVTVPGVGVVWVGDLSDIAALG
ncbi:MAG: response regulator transcription factor [Elusimicrobia bacterium]|nr:response regulator transcription factor [Elusimicrobiota bacterium]